MSGGVGEKTGNLVLNRATDALRAPGSSFKPLAVYAPAIELGLITPSTLVNDAPREEVEMSQDQWYPKNSDWKYRGYMDIATAVRLSINTVAAQVLDKLGLDASTNFLKNKLGITSLVEQDYNYAPLALGELTNGVSVLEMAQAYCAFANDGILTEARTYTRVTDAEGNVILDNQPSTHVAMKSSTATNITSMLNAAATYGTGSEANFYTMPVAGKTGTSSDNWNRWFAGYTPYYVCRCLDGLRPAGVHQHLRQPRGPGLEACHAAGARWPRIQELPEPGLDRRRHEDIRATSRRRKRSRTIPVPLRSRRRAKSLKRPRS